MGATVALELSHELAAAGDTTALVLIDPRIRRPETARYWRYLAMRRLRQRRFGGAITRRMFGRAGHVRLGPEPTPVLRALESARNGYVPRPTASPVALLRSATYETEFDLPEWYLDDLFPNIVHRDTVHCKHGNLFQGPTVRELHEAIARSVARLESEFAS
jgi:thioesterase domain-containing protein